MRTLIDGLPAELIPVDDRGLLYGDGLFETIAVRAGEPALWRLHLDRLEQGAQRLGIAVSERERWHDEARAVIGAADEGVLKLILSRGSGARGYRPPEPCRPRRIVQFSPQPDAWVAARHDGIRLRSCATRLAIQPALAGIKHLQRLEQVLARLEWDDPSIEEGLMLDTEGQIVEGTQSNLFLMCDGSLVTPPLDRCGVAGVMRAATLALARAAGLPVTITPVEPAELERADALFVTNSLWGALPVRALDGRRFDPASDPRPLLDAINRRGFAPDLVMRA